MTYGIHGYSYFNIIVTEFPTVTEYPLWVGGTQVTSENSEDTDGTRGWSYTPATDTAPATLTLNGYLHDGMVHQWGEPPAGAPQGTFMKSAAIYAEEALTITVGGTNDITGASGSNAALSENHGIYVDGDLTINGDGTLNAQSGTSGRAILSTKNMTIDGASVKAEGEGDAVYASYNLVIKDGAVEAAGKYGHGICAVEGSVTIDKGTVTASDSEDSTGGTCGILAYTDITINGGTVNASSVSGRSICTKKDIVINNGIVTATGAEGICSFEGSVTINGGTVEATGNEYGICYGTYGTAVNINGGTVTATGKEKGIDGTVINSVQGVGYTDLAGTEGETVIPVSADGQTLGAYKMVKFPYTHVHSFTQFLKWVWDGIKSAVAWIACETNPDHVMTTDVPSAIDTVDEPTCTEDGYIYHVATIDVAGKIYTTVNVETLDQLGHDWGEPEWTWSDDCSEATATQTCGRCGETRTETADIAETENEDGSVTYTATVTLDGVTYTDTKTVEAETADKPTPDEPTPDKTTPDEPEPEKEIKGILGDVNNDGQVDSADALLILRNSVQLEKFDAVQKFLGDVNEDNENIDSSDALAVLRYSVGLIDIEKIGTPVSKTVA